MRKYNKLEVGEKVDFFGSQHLVYGTIKKFFKKNGRKVAIVFFKTPNMVQECTLCYSADLTVVNGNGEIQCCVCGHKHGFKRWKEEFPIKKIFRVVKE